MVQRISIGVVLTRPYGSAIRISNLFFHLRYEEEIRLFTTLLIRVLLSGFAVHRLPILGCGPPLLSIHFGASPLPFSPSICIRRPPCCYSAGHSGRQAGRQARVNKQEKLGHGRTREGTKKWDKNNLVDSRARAPYLMETV